MGKMDVNTGYFLFMAEVGRALVGKDQGHEADQREEKEEGGGGNFGRYHRNVESDE
jgi:hypothetical protein